MKNIFYLLILWPCIGYSEVPVLCSGGSGSDYGGMTCTVPYCSIANNPSLGCPEGEQPAQDGSVKCYPTGEVYLDSIGTVTGTTLTRYPLNEGDMMAEMQNFCASNPTGYANPSTELKPFNGGTLQCLELATDTVTQFCDNL